MWLERPVLGIVGAQNPAPTQAQAEQNSEDALQESSSVCERAWGSDPAEVEKQLHILEGRTGPSYQQ